MIELTRLNGSRFVLNADLIRVVEELPDTTITLTTGERMVVREAMRDVVARSIDYARQVRRLIPPG
ncbi:MAG: flagellar FlbD family protein [Planctomycetota bacterium]